jgi:hypothetical protein
VHKDRGKEFPFLYDALVHAKKMGVGKINHAVGKFSGIE